MSNRNADGTLKKGHGGLKRAGSYSNKGLVKALESSLKNAVREFIKENSDLASQLSLALNAKDLSESDIGFYIIKEIHSSKYRIGVSSMVDKRVSTHIREQLQGIEIICILKHHDLNVINSIEERVFDIYKANRIELSWFDLSDKEVLDIIIFATNKIYSIKK